MTINIYHNIRIAMLASAHYLKTNGQKVKVDKWQGIEAPKEMFEAFDLSWKAPMPHTKKLLAEQTGANLPWAEEHFLERVSGIPHNPPPSHTNWPFGQNNNKRFTKDEKFNHTYPERFWPKYAGDYVDNVKPGIKNIGIRYDYGDYNDLILLLKRDPTTRQAYLPIFFPEDTGAVHGGRVPCTLGYLIYQRNGLLNISYKIRACDYIRHFRDDIYMAVRLAQDILERLQKSDPWWMDIKLGYIKFECDNFHVFSGEEKILM